MIKGTDISNSKDKDSLSYKKVVIFATLILLLGLVSGYKYHAFIVADELVSVDGLQQIVDASKEDAADLLQIAVHVTGAVENPGLYWLDEGSRVNDALTAAGVLETADTDQLNLAAVVADGSKIVVPYKTNSKSSDETPSNIDNTSGGLPSVDLSVSNNIDDSAASAKVNINTATVEQLKTLYGIGDSRANAIVKYREENGDFAAIEHITRVSGIGDGIFSNIKDNICVD